MNKTTFYIDDAPMQILYLDQNIEEGRQFFNRGLGTLWFDYTLHLIDDFTDADKFLTPTEQNDRGLDLLFIASGCWASGGEALAKKIRRHPQLAEMPIYCVASCQKKLKSLDAQCWDISWRQKTDCNKDQWKTEMFFAPFREEDRFALINGTICAQNLAAKIPHIINDMTSYWMHGG